MSGELKTNEVCKCEDHQEVFRQRIEIEVLDDRKLKVIEHHPTFQHSEEVCLGGSSSFTQRSYADLLKLGPGLHRICRCNNIGPAGSIYRSKKPE